MWPCACITALTMARRCGVMRSPRARRSSMTSICSVRSTARDSSRVLQVQVRCELSGGRQIQGSRGPRERGPSLPELQRPDVRRLGDLGPRGVRARSSRPGARRARRRRPGGSRRARVPLRRGGSAARHATSASGFPTHAKFQSIRTARPSRMQRLSLRTSKCISASPSSGAISVANRRIGRASSSHALEQSPSARNGSGSSSISIHPWKSNWLSAARGRSGGGGVVATSARQASTAST